MSLHAAAALCARLSVAPAYVHARDIVGVAANLRTGIQPVNGLRHRPEAGTSGWYLWAGENLPEDPDFFQPLHAEHLADWCPVVIPFLSLPPGCRFLLAPGYGDVWFDESLLRVEP